MAMSPKHLAALAGGIAAGILGSRMLPPVVAAGTGSIRSRMGGDPFELLIRDHREIVAILQKMERATTADSLASRGKLFLKLKRTLAKHAMAEEDVVYPMLHHEAGEQGDTRHLYEEHADIKIRLFELELMLKADQDWRETVTSLRQLIEEHAREEEQEHFPKIRRALGDRRSQSLAGQIHREEALVL